MLVRLLILLTMAWPVETIQGAEAQPEFLLRVWQSEEGLPGNVVRSIGQTSDGYLWIATAEGLARFNGIDFKVLSGSGSYHGRRLGLFRIFTPTDGSVWVSTFGGGLLKVTENGQELFISSSEQPSAPLITRLFTHEEKVYFIRAGDLYHLNGPDIEAVSPPSPALRQALEADQTIQQRRGRRDSSQSPEQLLNQNGDRWRIIDRNLTFQKKEAPRRSLVGNELAGRVVANDLLEDHEGNLWMASPVQGLIRIRNRRVTGLPTKTGPYQDAIFTAIQARDGSWWTAPRNGGVDRIKDGTLTHLELEPGGYFRPIVCIFQDSRDRLWFASRDGSIFEWTGEAFEPRFTRAPTISKVNTVGEDSQGRLWFGGSNGLSCWDGESVKNVADDSLLLDIDISSLAIAADGTVFLGTTDGKILALKDEKLVPLPLPEDFEPRWISSLLILGSDELWATTLGSGLLVRKAGRWHHFNSKSGLPELRLTGIAHSTGDDSLWIGSLAGIIRVSRVDLLKYCLSSSSPPGWLRLDRSDGLLSRECVGGSQPGVSRDLAGKLWFPTVSGLAGVAPEGFQIERTPPKISFNRVEVDGLPIPTSSLPLSFGPGRIRLGVSFIGLNLSAPEKVTYRVRLVGLDEEPRFIGTQREFAYESVPPGRYRFEVTARNGDGIPTPYPAAIPFEIHPHFWQSPWFTVTLTASLLALALGSGALLARRRMNVKLQALRVTGALENERARISRDLHDDLGASLTELSLLSALAEEDPDDTSLRPSLNQLSFKAKRVVSTLDEIVWATTPTEDSLRSLIEYLAAFAREFLESAQIKLRTDIERNIPDVPIGPRRRHGVFLATRESLNNAVKHSKADEILFQIQIAGKELHVIIEDFGKGFIVAEHLRTGNGLSNLPLRMKTFGGSCRIESEPGKGTKVLLTLPLPLPLNT